jgi:hypothetical protein
MVRSKAFVTCETRLRPILRAGAFLLLAGSALAASHSVSKLKFTPQSQEPEGQPGAPAVSLSPVALAFGSQHVGANSKMQVVLLKNTGSGTLNINSAIRIDGSAASEFHLQAVHQPCPETTGEVPPNASCSIGIVFAPVSSGAKKAQLVIEDDAAGSPHAVELSGSGVSPSH